jgi:ABC-type transport system substrate-binding protein
VVSGLGMKLKEIVSISIIVIFVCTSIAQASTMQCTEPFFSLTILTSPGKAFSYANYIIRYLRDIGIESRIKVENYKCNEINSYPNIKEDWDLAICSFEGGGNKPDMRNLFTEEGSQNIFNLDSGIPYQNDSEFMQNEAVSTSDLEERQQLYYDWQDLLMKEILPVLPLFSPRIYTAIWSNTEGFDMRWGISSSSPYMSFNGLHEGQESADELNIAFNEIRNLEPLFIENSFTSLF